MRRAFAVLFLAVLMPRLASATMIFPGPWQELVANADLVGVVECTRAGGLVAEYRVIESWKGPPAGTRLAIRVPENPHGPIYPLTLAGERWVVAAARTVRDQRVASYTSGPMSPLWLRNLGAAYALPLFRGRCLLPAGNTGPIELGLGGGGEEGFTFSRFRAECRKLIAMKPDRLEAELLRASAEKKLFTPGGDTDFRRFPELMVLREALVRSTSGQASAAMLIALARAKRPRWAAYEALFVLDEEGRAGTLAALEGLTQWRVPRGSPRIEGIRDTIRERLGVPLQYRPSPGAKPARAPETVEQLELDLALGQGDQRTFAALAKLIELAPERAARALCRWRPVRALGARAPALAVELVSSFGHAVARQTPDLLSVLAKEASDPYVRVGGAVYLAMIRHAAGVALLRTLSALPGVPGAWAALNLARRGDTAAAASVLDKLDGLVASAHPATGLVLRERLVELLSNAARASGLPQPVTRATEDIFGQDWSKKDAVLAVWMRRHVGAVRIRDPWLEQRDAELTE